MYSFEPSEEQKMLVDAITRYAKSDLRAKAHDAEEDAHLPEALIEKGWELGFIQASVPEEFGGFGEHSVLSGLLAAEELAFGDLAGAMAVLAPGLFVFPILEAGTQEQKEKYLPPAIEAEWRPYTAAFIENRFDFDPNDMQTKAEEQADGYVLNGEKVYVPYADQAEAMLVYVRLGDQTQAFIVEKDAPGLSIGERQKTLGIHALPLFSVKFENVHVPKENRLGREAGFDFERILAEHRLALAGLALGVSRAAFEYSREYAKEREAFSVKIAQKQAIAFFLAEMATEIEAIRLLAWEAAWMLDNGKPDADKQAYIALNSATDMAMMVTDRAVQILGGHGYIREHPVELFMRNGRGIAMLNGLAVI